MKIIRKSEMENQLRPDGRTVMDYLSFDVNFDVKNVGFIKAKAPKGCHEREHIHTKSDVLCFYLTDAVVEINSKEYEIKEGDLVILHAGDRHHQIPRANDIDLIEVKIPNIHDKEYTDDDQKDA